MSKPATAAERQRLVNDLLARTVAEVEDIERGKAQVILDVRAADFWTEVRNSMAVPIQEEHHAMMVAKGFWEIDGADVRSIVRELPEDLREYAANIMLAKLALVGTEVSEACEEVRKGNREAFGEELADIVLRVMDVAEVMGIKLMSEVAKKVEKNRSRPARHGGKLA